MSVLCIVDQDHQISVVVVDNSWKFKTRFFKRTTFQEKARKNCCLDLKKGKVKTKKLSKITMVDEQEPSVQSAGKVRTVQV